jgi:hypothetical protein
VGDIRILLKRKGSHLEEFESQGDDLDEIHWIREKEKVLGGRGGVVFFTTGCTFPRDLFFASQATAGGQECLDTFV